ncbi:unnamed protein product [Gongylonema pulchrum]|uniref:AAA_6 domain-containing protein n=1 Tax=Gongylonema pulchrum TaxID=637853 RepID=A0A183ESR3_9BILA|nr:unnamed protein product [Gongylonema pulchrum]
MLQVRTQYLTDTALLQLCTLGTGPFFVDNVGELQMQSITLLSAIFSRHDHCRQNIVQVCLILLDPFQHSAMAGIDILQQ